MISNAFSTTRDTLTIHSQRSHCMDDMLSQIESYLPAQVDSTNISGQDNRSCVGRRVVKASDSYSSASQLSIAIVPNIDRRLHERCTGRRIEVRSCPCLVWLTLWDLYDGWWAKDLGKGLVLEMRAVPLWVLSIPSRYVTLGSPRQRTTAEPSLFEPVLLRHAAVGKKFLVRGSD